MTVTLSITTVYSLTVTKFMQLSKLNTKKLLPNLTLVVVHYTAFNCQ